MKLWFLLLSLALTPTFASGAEWKIIEKIHFDWRGDKRPYEFILKAPGRIDGGDYTQLQIKQNGKVLCEVMDDDGLAKLSDALPSEGKMIGKKNILKSKYLLMLPDLKGNSKHPLLLLFGWPYASDPGSLHVVALGNDGVPKEILSLKNFDVKLLPDAHKNIDPVLVGKPCTSEVWGPKNSFLSYSPFHVYRFGATPTSPMTLDLKLSESYNKNNYYGWVGPACSEEILVLLHPPGGGKPSIMEAKKAEKLLRRK